MADVSVNVGVTGISQFKSGMSDAQASIKGLDAALKLNEKQLKASGNAEKDLATRTDLLNGKLEAQKRLLKNAEDALKQMEENGVRKSSKAYQDMQRHVLEAQSAIMDTQADIENVGKVSAEAAGKTDQLGKSLSGLNKKVSLEQVISTVDKLTGGMEKAAKKAVDLGKAIWENITDTARWSDDTATQAMVLNMGIEEYQQYKGVFDTIGEITVQEWQKAKMKVQSAINKPSDEQTDILKLLGVDTHEISQGKYGAVEGAARDFEEVFWEIGRRLREKVQSGEMTQDLADTYANAIFGKGFAELNPMFELGEEGFREALKKQVVASEEAVKKNAELNDKLIELQKSYTALKTEVLSGLAPGLTGAADSLNKMLASLMEYLQTPEGQKALEDMEKAVSGLFDDLGKIDPEQVVQGFTGVLDKVVGGIQWLDENKETVVNTLKYIVMGWGGLKLLGGGLEIFRLIQGITGLAGGGMAEAAATAGASAGTSWGTAFAAAVMKAAPWLIGLYTLLKPGGTSDNLGDNTLIDANGNLTKEAEAYGFKKDENGEAYQDRTQIISEAAQKAWDLYRTNQLTQAGMEELRAAILNDNQFQSLMDRFMDFRNENGEGWKNIEDIDLTEWLKGIEPPKVQVDPEAPADAGQKLEEEIGTLTVPVVFVPSAGGESVNNTNKRLRNTRNGLGGLGFANGLPYVPMDGMYFLHQGETVTPKRETSRNFSSNLYVEKMVMNNGQDAEGLAGRIAAENQRVMSGFGS